jgi:colanic acid biosynthesis glycosyl transferase WcaI
MTDPPIIANVAIAVARRFRAPLVVVSQDVFPEIAIELGRLENPAIVGALRILIHGYLRRADRVVAIGDRMRQRLEAKGARPDRVDVIPNWVDTTLLVPRPRDNDWAREHDLHDKFVVMHSGNVGHAQDLDNLVRAASFLRDLDRLRVVVVGAGARLMAVKELAERLGVDNVLFLPYQDRGVLPESLSSADLHFIGLAKGLSGYVVPSRFYGVLSVARPVIVAADADGETAQIVEETGCGLVVPPGRPDRLAAAIRSAYGGELDLDEMGRRGREYVVEHADRAVAVERYRRLIDDMAASARLGDQRVAAALD